jgi:hypothetical protein
MAGILETYLQDIRIKFPNALDKDEWRAKRYGLLNTAIEHNASPFSILTPDLVEKAKISQGRVIDVPVMKKGALSVSNVRSCTIGSFENESEMVNLTWATMVVDISMVRAQYAKNEIAYTADLSRKLILVKEAMLNQIESAIYTKLDTEKSTVFNSTLVGAGNKYDLVGDAIQVPKADQSLFFNDVETIQNADDFYGENYITASTNMMSSVNHFINQGGGNDVNLNYQFADKAFRFSNAVTNGAGVVATGFIMPLGTLGLLTRVDVDAMTNSKANDGTEWGTIRIDGIPFDIGYMYKSFCSDQSALNGTGLEHLKATMVEKWQFSVDYALMTPYNSDSASLSSAIKKVEFLNV